MSSFGNFPRYKGTSTKNYEQYEKISPLYKKIEKLKLETPTVKGIPCTYKGIR